MAAKSESAFVPKVILGVAAHPDDLCVTASGAIAAWTAQGARAYYLILTNGSKGSDDLQADPRALAQTRREEQREAAKLVGVSEVFFCDYEDGELLASMEVKKDICRIIRKIQPDTVVTMDPTIIYDAETGMINHPDHRAAGQATLDAVYPLARDHLSFPDLYSIEKLEPHKVKTLLLSNFKEPNCSIDITHSIDNKLAAISAHKSQFKNMDRMHNFVRIMAEQAGSAHGYAFAEPFVRLDII